MSTADATLPVDYRLDDYRIVALLGQGGFGITYKARDERLERFVAIKEYLPRQFATRDEDATVRPRTAEDGDTFQWGLTRFIDEARALARFKHPNIVAVIRYLEANGTAYLVMEYEEGRDLEKWIATRSEPPTEDELVRRILLPLLDGLERIHAAGLLHRDIKPENVFIRRDGSPVLIDFGASRAQSGSASMTSIVSAGYSPFEQYGAGEGQGPWSDLYALAGTMYRVVVGRPPTDAISRFQGQPHGSAAEAAAGRYSPAFLAAIDRALMPEPAQRPQSAAELVALLTHGDTATVVMRQPARRRSRTPLVAGVAAAIAAAALGVGWFVWSGRAPPTLSNGSSEVASPASVPAAPSSAPSTTPAVATASSETDEGVEAQPGTAGAPETPVEAEPLDEDGILEGLAVSDAVRAYRHSQIGGALLAYVSNRQKFDDCIATGCAQLASHMAKVQEALDGYPWEEGNASGRLRVANPRRLARDDCTYLLDVVEEFTIAADRREQTRAYCTTNGFDRVLQTAGDVKRA